MTPGVQRWFDGRDWTEHTRPLPESALRTAAARTPATAGPSAASGSGGARATDGSWLPTSGAAWVPGEPVPEPAIEAAPAWVGAAATGWGGGAVSRFGSPAPAYDVPGAAAPVVRPLGAPVGPGPSATTWSSGMPAVGWRPTGSPAHWGWRVLATLLDGLIVEVPYVVGFFVAASDGTVVLDAAGQPQLVSSPSGMRALLVGALLTFLLWFVNRVVLQGRTGASWGKRICGLRVVHEGTEKPLGMWWALVRDIANIVNGVPLYLGYLWPLWDARRQAFSDKLTHAVVLRDPR